MKKIVSILILLILMIDLSWVNADTYTLSAIVGNSNHTPIVTEVIPDSDPRYLDNSTDWDYTKQNYSIKFRDDENDDVDYTITVESDWWGVTPTSGSITSYDSDDEAYIFFEYTAPTSAVWAKEITVTITDWPNVTVQTLNVYIY